jgi:hypothetical protein
MKARLILSLSLLFLLSACGKGFQTVDDGAPRMASLSSSSELTSATTDKVASSEGEIAWAKTQDDAGGLHFAFAMKVPFGKVYKTLSTVTRWMAPYACKWVDPVQMSPIASYETGEIPCGLIVDSHWKQLFAITLNPLSGSSDGFKYQIGSSAIVLPIDLSREAGSGNYSEASLDTRTTVTRASSKNFGEDISLRYTPDNSATRLEMCLNLPGTTIKGPEIEIHAKASKRILGIDINESSDLKIDPGQASYDYGRSCVAVDFGWVANATAPSLGLKVTQAPMLSHVSYSGLSIHIEDWFLRLLDNIMGAFNASLREKLIASTSKIVNSVADKDVESGQWFTRVHGQAMLDGATSKMNQRFAKIVSRAGIPSSVSDVRAMLHDACNLKKLSLSQAWTQRLENFCTDIVDQTQIEISPFAVDADSKTAGCYDSFARIHDTQGADGKDKWWAKTCQFEARFAITLPADLKDYENELKQIVTDLISESKVPTDWKAALDELGVDDYLRALVIEEAVKKGLNQIQSGDWRTGLASIIDDVRAQVATATE